MLLELHPEAAAELEAAVLFHDQERPGHGRLLLEEVGRRVAQAGRLARSGAPVTGFAPERDVRCHLVRRFHYRIVTALVRGNRVVIAIPHTSREPDYWRGRLK